SAPRRSSMSSVENAASVAVEGLAGDLTIDYGIGGYYTNSNLDLIFPFDFKSVNMLDHLVVYRPGTGTIWILEKQTAAGATELYPPVFQQGDPAGAVKGEGIGGYDLMHKNDRAFAFDLEGSGKMDDLVFYRPGSGEVCILQNQADNPGTFAKVYPPPG